MWTPSVSGYFCLAAGWFDHPELWIACGALLAMAIAGTAAIYAAYRWYRTHRPSSEIKYEALADLERALANQLELGPEEIARVRAAIEQNQGKTEPPQQ